MGKRGKMATKEEMLDAWYDAKKQELFSEYSRMLEQGKSGAEESYRAKTKALRERYERKVFGLLDKERRGLRRKPILPKIEEGWSKVVRLFNER